MLGTSLAGYGQAIVSEVIAVGRAGTLVDWEGEVENRVYVSRYAAEDILNWRTERINGRNLLTTGCAGGNAGEGRNRQG